MIDLTSELIRRMRRSPPARVVMLAIATLAAFSATATSTLSAENDPACSIFSAWTQAQNQFDHASSTAEAQRASAEARQARVTAADKLFDQFFAGTLDFDQTEKCLSLQKQSDLFLNTLQAVFYTRTLNRLRATQSPAIRWFITLLDGQFSNDEIPLFRVTGHFRQQSPGTYVAGFHRDTGSIYMDLSRIPPNEWTLLFVHELLHDLDPLLSESIHGYSRSEVVHHLVSLAQSNPDPAQWTSADRDQLNNWLQAGLGRGLWAEYRAWYPTLIIYQEGVQERLWSRIDWVEQILSLQSAPQGYSNSLYAFLDDHSADPSSGIFAVPFFANALRNVRIQARTRPETVPLGKYGTVPFSSSSTY